MSKSFSHEQLLSALFGIQDIFERGRAQFFIAGPTLIRVINSLELEGDKITVGIKKAELTAGATEVMKTAKTPDSWTDTEIVYTFSDVPVHIRIYLDDIQELQNPETIVYAYEVFNIPNPYKTFLQKNL